MSFRTYEQGLKQATDQANKAIQIESTLSTLSPLVSPLHTLQKAFPAYISSAEVYSHLLASSFVPAHEVSNIRKKWRLVLERAEKIKYRIESLGGQVGKVEIGDEGEESAVLRRGSRINNLELPLWTGEPSGSEFREDRFIDDRQPELAEEQLKYNPIWKEVPVEAWSSDKDGDRWVLKQGPVSDCSVVAAMGVGLEHDRRFGNGLNKVQLYPKSEDGRSRRSENGKHVLKLLLNGAWRKVVFDSLLPHTPDSKPLYTTCHPASVSEVEPSTSIGVPWIPLALKGYFKAFGGYSLKGSNPAPDIYAYIGWIPERVSLKEGFQREKEWKRIYERWQRGEVMVSLGTGEKVTDNLVKLHAYGVVALREEGVERLMDVFDPGATAFTMTWDQVCSEFEALHLNWKPDLMPVVTTRHWSWPKPKFYSSESTQPTAIANTQYRLKITSNASDSQEIWILLSQHITSKDRPLDDIALHVFEEYDHGGKAGRLIKPERADQTSPYANDMHILVRYILRRSSSTILVIPARDRGNFQTGFTLNAFAAQGSTLTLERISQSMPFSQVISGSLNSRNAGGHPGYPTHLLNPQYKVMLRSPPRGGNIEGRITLQGEKERAWNVKLLWGKGELVYDVSEDMVVADTGSYSYGMAYCDISSVNPGTYTLVVSSFEPNHTGLYTLSFESTAPADITPIPAEGAGMYSRVVNGAWTKASAGGRPSSGGYDCNPKVEVMLPTPGIVLSRLYLPTPSSIPINLTIFRRGTGGGLGEQIGTTGPYADTLNGVTTGKVKLDQGIYVFVPSSYEPVKSKWVLKVWSDVAISVEPFVSS
ncbi:calpain-like protease palB/RIM13 [Kwoniella mangroviensis CBS 10435]|uniref:Calpain-like protease palB/RIM13 n=1 Tax=Kwoniella mangroviensis CBS 10435 TaxID=1331196 RepID=A0A1B9IRL1_9TREE|nr:calpain-like protease palB/RIM13 [Kwoniella mangroviensis CBS 10435]